MRWLPLLLSLLLLEPCAGSSFGKTWRSGRKIPGSESRTPLGSELPATQRAQLHGLADSLLRVYNTLVDMRYLDPVGIELGPHRIDVELCKEKGIAAPIIYLYQILPYVNETEAGQEGFVWGSQFADFREADDIHLGRDPLFAGWEEYGASFWSEDPNEQNLPYIAPWCTPLVRMGNHQCVLVYDAQRDRIWVIDQLDERSCDPALRNIHTSPNPSNNRNNIDHIPNRPAQEVLSDIVTWYRNLDIIPGDDPDRGVENWDYEAFKELYQKNGWPDAFNGDAFEVDLARYQIRDSARYFAGEAPQRLERSQLWLRNARDRLKTAETKLATASNPNDVWKAKYEVYTQQRRLTYSQSDFESARQEFDRLCPAGECHREDMLLIEEVKNLRNRLESMSDLDDSYYVNARYHEKRLKVLELAWRQAEAEAEKICPDLLAASWELRDRGNEEDIAKWIVGMEKEVAKDAREIEELEDFLRRVPQDIEETRGQVEDEIRRYQERIGQRKQRLEQFWNMRLEKWMKRR